MVVEDESGPDPAVCMAISPLRRADLAIKSLLLVPLRRPLLFLEHGLDGLVELGGVLGAGVLFRKPSVVLPRGTFELAGLPTYP